MMKIFVITDGGNKYGLGHIYQSICLANYLSCKSTDCEINFFTKSKPFIVDIVNDFGYTARIFNNDQEIFEAIKINLPDRVIFDKVDVCPKFAKRIKELGIKLIIFTNITKANDYADISVMATMGSHFKNYKGEDKKGIKYFGPRYLILRPEFYKYNNEYHEHFSKKNVLLMFGGADPANLSTLILQELLRIGYASNITVVLGNAFIFNDQIEDLINSRKDQDTSVGILRNVSNIAEVMVSNDIIFTSPGISFFEALSLNKPVFCFHQNDFQKKAWQADIKTYDVSEIEYLEEILNDGKYISPNDEFVKNMEIGQGKDELVDMILN